MNREEVGAWGSGSGYGRLLLSAPSDDCWRDIHGVKDQVAPASRLRPAPPLVGPKPTGLVLAVAVGRRVGGHPPADRWPRPQAGPDGRATSGSQLASSTGEGMSSRVSHPIGP